MKKMIFFGFIMCLTCLITLMSPVSSYLYASEDSSKEEVRIETEEDAAKDDAKDEEGVEEKESEEEKKGD